MDALEEMIDIAYDNNVEVEELAFSDNLKGLYIDSNIFYRKIRHQRRKKVPNS